MNGRSSWTKRVLQYEHIWHVNPLKVRSSVAHVEMNIVVFAAFCVQCSKLFQFYTFMYISNYLFNFNNLNLTLRT